MSRATTSRDEILGILHAVKDPEVPVLSVVELGIVRDVIVEGDVVTVRITPTYSGCPAMHEIERDIVGALEAQGITGAVVELVYAPAWTTDWIGADAREKLRAAGIAPPGPADHGAVITLARRRATVHCPYCGSASTQLKSEFGSTACKAIHVCNACDQPFDEFKAF
ncbi:MAG TPA: 1,2-phenylacetyl-CoA epoxidase subunit PaaD [Gemmatimonadaceae bacterium]|nr:1,2-phenylacetyl-CoA epoxidase subunit PaaD [Gemmatimonadaceae bacterium]